MLLDGQGVFPFQPKGSRKFAWQVSGYQLNSGNRADQHVIFDMEDHFAKPQSNGAALLKKSTPRPTPPWNTVSMYIALFRRNNMKQNRLEKQNFKKENGKCTNVSSRTCYANCPGCNQMTFPRPAVSFRGGTTRESGGNRAYTVLSTSDRFVRPCYFNVVPWNFTTFKTSTLCTIHQ